MTEAELDARHAEKMRKKKAARDKIMATKTIEKGLLIVHTGKGKGKSTAAFGMVFRALGHGMPVAIVQFVKGTVADRRARGCSSSFADLVTINTMGEGFTWETQDRAARHRRGARRLGAGQGADHATSEHRLVLLDELNIVLRYDYLPVDEVVAFLRDEKPADMHVIVTGRNAKDELIEIADLVTEMDDDQASVPLGREGAAGDRVLTTRDARRDDPGHRLAMSASR